MMKGFKNAALVPRTNGVQMRALFKVGIEEEEALNKDMARKAP